MMFYLIRGNELLRPVKVKAKETTSNQFFLTTIAQHHAHKARHWSFNG